jgi:hypothetical protein
LKKRDKLGNFNPGKEADLVVLDWNGGPRATSWHQSMVTDGVSPSTMEQAADLDYGTASLQTIFLKRNTVGGLRARATQWRSRTIGAGLKGGDGLWRLRQEALTVVLDQVRRLGQYYSPLMELTL